MNRYLKPSEVARRLDKSPRAIARLILRDELPAIRTGRTYRIAECEFEAYLERARVRSLAGAGSDRLRAAAATWQHDEAARRCEAAGL